MESESLSEKFSPELLREWREKACLSRRKLALLAQLSYSSIHDYESGEQRPLLQTWKRVKEALRKICKPPQMIDTWITPQQELTNPKEYSFIIGQMYTIKNIRFGEHKYHDIQPHSGALCLFKYIGKNGIHHVFREIRGGWSRTYTDAQLIGKHIKEHTQ